MKISYNWLQEYFDKKLPDPKTLAREITMHAYEVESVEEKAGDFVLNIDVLPNRSADSFSHDGVAREVSAILGFSLKTKKDVDLSVDESVQSINVSIDASDLCPRYIARVIEGIEIKESPEWMKAKLASLGQKSINNVVDATNIVMFETGQPLHAFDLKNVFDGKINVRMAKSGEKMVTLDDQNIELSESTLVISDGQRPLAIAGIKGGKDAGVSATTTSLVLEAANFNPTNTRKTSKKIGIRTESSVRFEHGISPVLAQRGMDRLSELILEVAGNANTKIGLKIDIYNNPQTKLSTTVYLEKINRVLGTHMQVDQVEEILKKLGFVFEKSGQSFIVSLPEDRLDLSGTGADKKPRQEYLIEEIGRIYGYENIIESMPIEAMNPPKRNKRYFYTEVVRNIFSGLGLTEIYNYSLTGNGDVGLKNFMSEDRSFLRKNLSGEFLSSIESNLRFFDNVKLFEFGTVFKKNDAGDIEEENHLIVGVGYRKIGKGDKKLFYELKGYLEVLFDELNVPFYITDDREDYEVIVANDTVGHISMDGCVEIDFDLLLSHVKYQEFVYEPIAKFPSVDRDVSLFVTPHTKVEDVEKTIREFAGPWLVDINVFDIFEKADKKSLAFRLIFQADDRTLSDEEVNDYMKVVYKALGDTPDWQIR